MHVYFKLILLQLPYFGKVWWVESLANLANRLRFAKIKPSKLQLITLWLIYSFPSAKWLERVNSPNILPAKLSCFMVSFTLSLCLSLSVSLCVCPSLCLSLCVSLSLSLCLSVCLSLSLSNIY